MALGQFGLAQSPIPDRYHSLELPQTASRSFARSKPIEYGALSREARSGNDRCSMLLALPWLHSQLP